MNNAYCQDNYCAPVAVESQESDEIKFSDKAAFVTGAYAVFALILLSTILYEVF